MFLMPCLLWLAYALPPAPPVQDVPDYFVKFVQERTFFANDEPVWLIIRLGNQAGGELRSRRFPDILASLRLSDGENDLKLSKKFSSKLFYRGIRSLGYGAHKDFRLNLRRYYPAMKGGYTYQVFYEDRNYSLESKKIRIADIPTPDLDAEYVLDTSKGEIRIKLDAEQAPNHSRNFALLVATNFYRNMIFHRVINSYVIQTGDPLGTGVGGSGFSMALEKSPFLKHHPYMVGMARGDAEDSATSQFYITLERLKQLDELYTVFGKVVAGQEVVDAIGSVPTSGNTGRPPDKPLEDVVLFSVRIKE
jgi:cyclophilin family peptidyl-prolyl cis-trans isomerase